jgi:protein Tex
MIDLQGVARQLRLTVEQLRIAADLLQQGYHPAFIERYRADETGGLSRHALWTLKMEIDRKQRLEGARQKAKDQLPRDAELDEEGVEYLQRSTTEVEMEAALRAYRARRALHQSQERDGQAGQLLEMLISYDGPAIDDLTLWVAERLGVDRSGGEQALQATSRLIGTLVQCDTPLIERLRRAIQRKAKVRIELLDASHEESTEKAATEKAKVAAPKVTAAAHLQAATDTTATTSDTEASNQQTVAPDSPIVGDVGAAESAVSHLPEAVGQEADVAGTVEAAASVTAHVAEVSDHVAQTEGEEEGHLEAEHHHDDAEHHDDDEDVEEEASSGAGSKGGKSRKGGKLTPRQRRRRWLMAMLQPMKSIKRPLTQLTSFQHLMLGRGRRSQLVKMHLDYDVQSLVPMARDAFVGDKHPLSKWFEESVSTALESSSRSRIEADAIADLEEIAQERLLEGAADQLRQHLMRRPVRGHRIMLVDTVGPKLSSVVVIDAHGDILAVEELPCSAQPEIVNQNVVKLGELAHKHRVTLVALTNGPARRFLVLTVRELMKQSENSGLRWTMADRSGAEAYAAGKIGLKELSAHNRRDRAAIWIARSLQNPLAEMLKVDMNRMRLGSYQRELPQEPLRRLLHDVIADCVCSRGIDTHHASVHELQFVPGVHEAEARQIADLASSGKLESRQQLKNAINDWPELQSRQALGWLRVFGSEQALDATAIHPDDYRLAQRLIDNTELSAPANAPEGWKKRVVAAPVPPSDPQPVVADAVGDASDTALGEPTEEASAEAVAADTTNAAVESMASSDSSHDEAGAEAAVAEPVSGPSESGVMDPAEMSFKPAAAAEPAPSIKPEYPEEVETQLKPALTLDVEKLARGWQVGRGKLKWIAHCLADPFEDPRLAETPVPMRTDMPTLESLQPGMCVWAVVVGVADFGAFVELSPDCNGLIHISRLSSGYIEDTHQCVQVGDLLLTWVVSKDEKKNRVALTALSPAQRAEIEAASQERRQREAAEQNRGSGPRRDRGNAGRGGPGTGVPREANAPADAASGGGRPAGGRDRGGRDRSDGGQQGGQSGRSQGRGQGAPAGQSHSGSGRGQDRGRGGGRGPGGRGGRDRSDHERPAKSVVVTSKKPVAPISEAMKEGDEPLRSFSDLLQFYEAKRTVGPETAPQNAEPVEIKVEVASEQPTHAEQQVEHIAEQPAAPEDHI